MRLMGVMQFYFMEKRTKTKFYELSIIGPHGNTVVLAKFAFGEYLMISFTETFFKNFTSRDWFWAFVPVFSAILLIKSVWLPGFIRAKYVIGVPLIANALLKYFFDLSFNVW